MPRVLNLLTSGEIGGIEVLCEDIAKTSELSQGFCFLFGRGTVYERMTEAGVRTYDLSRFPRKLSWGRFRELCRIAKDYDVVTVHHGDPFLKLYFAELVRRTGLRGVVMLHSCWEDGDYYPQSPLKKKMGKRFFQAAFDAADRAVFVSKAGYRSHTPWFRISEEKARVIYNGISMEKLEAGRNHSCTGKAPYRLTFVGRLEPSKGVELLLEAARNLRQRYAFTVTIVGDGSSRKHLEELTEAYGLRDIVNFEGRQADIIPYLRNTDISVCPSVCQEVFGISLVEAMAFGILCAANQVGGIPEILEDGVNGFLNCSCDAAGLERAIERAVQAYEDGSAGQITRKAKERAAQLTIQNNVKQLDDLYRELI